LQTFARGLPFAYSGLSAPAGTAIAVSLGAPANVSWTLRRGAAEWSLWSGADDAPTTTIEMSPSAAWRLWTKGLSADEARRQLVVRGTELHAEPLLKFVAIMA
jgi:hypothetical protein